MSKSKIKTRQGNFYRHYLGSCLYRTRLCYDFYPDKVSIALCYTLGGALTVYGLFNLITYFTSKQASFGFEMIVGIAATAFGVFFLISPQSILGMIFAIIGILIIVDSTIDIKRSFQLKSFGVKYWWISFVVSALIIILRLQQLSSPVSLQI